jgi:hypothetical protein
LQPNAPGKSPKGNNFEKIEMASVSTLNVSHWKARIMEKEAKIKKCYFKGLKLEYGYESEYSINEQIDADTD